MTIRQRKNATTSSGTKDSTSSDDKRYYGKKPQRIPSASILNGEQKEDELPLRSLIPAIIVSALVSVGSYYSCDSVDAASDAVVATLRTIVQLSLLAAMLSPLFRFVEKNRTNTSYAAPILVLGYVFLFMLPLAAYEASSRSTLTLSRPMNSTLLENNIVLAIVLVSLFTAVSIMGAVAVFAIVKPTPWYNPRHLIPLCGMLFNNALSSVSLALDLLFSELQTKQRDYIELMVSFGASPWIVTRPTFRYVLSSSLTPQLNSMNVIGLVAIPGMMTGQVLGGASPVRAARYQMIIMCLILGANFISSGMTIELVIWNAFDNHGALRDDWIINNKSMRVSHVISSSLLSKARAGAGRSKQQERALKDETKVDSSSIVEGVILTGSEDTSDSTPLLQANIQGMFAKGTRKMNASFSIAGGDITILRGGSGIGKTTLMKTIAMLNSGLTPSTNTSIELSLLGNDRVSPSDWRKKVLYLPQGIPTTLQGTPESFVKFVASLHHQSDLELLTSESTSYMKAFDIQSPEILLVQPWSKLSGGESQRILLAIALATEPLMLLLDEPTSALNREAKLKVEGILKLVAKRSCMLIVTHDEDQMKRIGTYEYELKTT